AKILLISSIFSFFFSADHTADKHESIKRIVQGMAKYPNVWLYISIFPFPHFTKSSDLMLDLNSSSLERSVCHAIYHTNKTTVPMRR
ncbi:hypothetical protein, partial [Escherichia coli]|uniref:hypothetical protein n=1 Tax=Escherichia coli TaxID=562 RepID=UPI001BD274A0